MIVGTAGHIDHGKTSLVKALTGVDADRLAEEKRRGITIDLGFAYKPLPGGDVLGFVDVPGHERFVHNMLAGVSGIDRVLLVVAADDGPMPQTVEHLQIVDLLGIDRGLVALTKKDLATPERLAEAEAEVRALLAPTGLAGADIVPVSALTGDGVEEIAAWLELEAESHRRRAGTGRFRLAVDRSFTLAGTGTVATGTVVSGEARVGDALVVSPSGIEARLRGVHAQNRASEVARAGDRCALNLAGPKIAKEAVARGDWIVDPAAHAPTDRIDAVYRHLPSEMRPLRHWTPVHVHLGAAHVPGRIAVLRDAPVAPGEEAQVQLVLDRRIGALAGDRFILRDQSAQRTIGGGRAVDPFPPARGRRTPQRLAQLAALAEPDPARAFAALLAAEPGWTDLTVFARARNLAEAEAKALFDAAPVVAVGGFGFAAATWTALRQAALETLRAFHAKNPEQPGLQPDRLRAALTPKLPKPAFAAFAEALAASRAAMLDGPWLRLPSHAASLSGPDGKMWARIEPLLRAERFSPPRVRDIGHEIGVPEPRVRELMKRLSRMGRTVEIAPDHFFLRETAAEMLGRAALAAAAQPDGAFTAAQFRDRIETGRKVAIQILEFYDRHGITFRRGDLRTLRRDRLNSFGPDPSEAAARDRR